MMKERDVLRWVHLVGAVAIGMFVYSPWRNQAEFLISMRVLIIPALILTGVWMWKGHQMRKFLNLFQSQPQD
jgi:thiosulfate reductase cytochrome b subunit